MNPHTSAETWDIVIVGGGLGGLALAAELASPAFAHLKVLVLEKRSSYVRDRTWSFWQESATSSLPAGYDALVRARWNQWCVRLDGEVATQQSMLAYNTIDADAFYAFATSRIENCAHVQLRLGVVVEQIIDGLQPKVVCSGGLALDCSWVMDARPPAPSDGAGLSQHFCGWEIQTTTDCFDSSTVELMDFQRSPRGLHFFYVLPYSPRQALVETTWISAGSYRCDYAEQLRIYLAARYGQHDLQPIYQEQGSLNLQPKLQATGVRVVCLGRAAGTLRPSTGFAFLETIADASRMAKLLLNRPLANCILTSHKRIKTDNWMDAVLFEAMQADWQRAPEFFMAMFAKLNPKTLVRFLSGKATWKERAEVARLLPTLPFLAAAFRSLQK